jgi:hypothetical protein
LSQRNIRHFYRHKQHIPQLSSNKNQHNRFFMVKMPVHKPLARRKADAGGSFQPPQRANATRTGRNGKKQKKRKENLSLH